MGFARRKYGLFMQKQTIHWRAVLGPLSAETNIRNGLGAEKRANLNMTNNYMTVSLFQSSMEFSLPLSGLPKARVKISQKCVVISGVYY